MFSTFLCCWSLQSHDCTAFLGSLLLRGGMSDQKVDKQCPMSNRAGKCIPCLCALLSLIPTGQSYAGQPAALRHLQSSTSQLLSSGPSSYSPPPHTISIPHTGCQSCQLLCTVGIYFPIRDYPPPESFAVQDGEQYIREKLSADQDTSVHLWLQAAIGGKDGAVCKKVGHTQR